MSAFWAYDGTTWRNITAPWAYDGTTWRAITTAWTYDGSVWRKVFEAVSCDDASCDSHNTGWGEAGCLLNTCEYCMSLEHTDCSDSCENIDGFLSTNGGSFLAQLSCTNKACHFQGATECGSVDFDCDLFRRCLLQSNNYQGQLKIQRNSDSTILCTRTGATKTGACIS